MEQQDTLLAIARKTYKRLVKHIGLILIVSAVGTILTVAFCVVTIILPPEKNPLPNIYTARAVILVDPSGGSGLSALMAAFGVQGTTNPKSDESVAVIEMILTSRNFIDQLAAEFSMAERYDFTQEVKTQTRLAIQENSYFDYSPDAGKIVIGFTDYDPHFATDFVNRKVDLLETWYAEFGGIRLANHLEILEVQMKNQDRTVSILEEKIRQFQEEYGAMSVDEIAEMQNLMLSDLRTQKLQLELQINTARQFSAVENENTINLRLQLENLDYLIDQLEKGYSGETKIMPAMNELPALAIEFDNLRQELAIQSIVYGNLKEQYEVARLNMEQKDSFTVFERAEVPDRKSAPSRSKICLAGAFLSFLLALLIAYIRGMKSSGRETATVNGDDA